MHVISALRKKDTLNRVHYLSGATNTLSSVNARISRVACTSRSISAKPVSADAKDRGDGDDDDEDDGDDDDEEEVDDEEDGEDAEEEDDDEDAVDA